MTPTTRRWLADTIQQHGLVETVAMLVEVMRIDAGRLSTPEPLLLLKMAHLERQRPGRSLHSIATEAIKGIPLTLQPTPESMVRNLERHYAMSRQKWLRLADAEPMPDTVNIMKELTMNKPSDEQHAIAQCVDALPEQIDVLEMLIKEAELIGRPEYIHHAGRKPFTLLTHNEATRRAKAKAKKPTKPPKAMVHKSEQLVALLRRFGRQRAEAAIATARAVMADDPSFQHPRWNGTIPRSLFELIKPELDAFAAQRAAE